MSESCRSKAQMDRRDACIAAETFRVVARAWHGMSLLLALWKGSPLRLGLKTSVSFRFCRIGCTDRTDMAGCRTAMGVHGSTEDVVCF